MYQNLCFLIFLITRYKNFGWSVIYTNMCETSPPAKNSCCLNKF